MIAQVTASCDDPRMVDLASASHEFAVVDVETTGLDRRKDRVVSVAVARCDAAGHLIERWYSLINPGCPMGASEIHGLTDEAVANAPSFEDIADDLLLQLGGAILVGHNIDFDWHFLSKEYARHGATLPAHDTICTMALAKELNLGIANVRLDTVAAYCEVPLARASFHDAREDVLATAGVFARLYPLAVERGVNPVVHLEPVTPPIFRKTQKCGYVNPGRPGADGRLVQGMHVVITGETSMPCEELSPLMALGLEVERLLRDSGAVTNDLFSERHAEGRETPSCCESQSWMRLRTYVF